MIGLFNFPLRQQPDGTIVSSGPISAPNLQNDAVSIASTAGATNVAASLSTQIADATTAGKRVILHDHYIGNSTLTIPSDADVEIRGTITGGGNGATILLNGDLAKLHGGKIVGANVRFTAGIIGASCYGADVKGQSVTPTIYLMATASAVCKWCSVRNVKMHKGYYGLYVNGAEDCNFTDIEGEGHTRTVMVLASSRCTYARIHSRKDASSGQAPVVGFLNMAHRTTAFGRGFVDNRYEDITIDGWTEEGFSFDIQGSSTNDSASVWHSKVASANSSGITLKAVPADADWSRYHCVFHKGALAGKAYDISGLSGGVVTLVNFLEYAQVAADDFVSIEIKCRGNVVQNLVAISSGDETGMMFWGFGYGTTVLNPRLHNALIDISHHCNNDPTRVDGWNGNTSYCVPHGITIENLHGADPTAYNGLKIYQIDWAYNAGQASDKSITPQECLIRRITVKNSRWSRTSNLMRAVQLTLENNDGAFSYTGCTLAGVPTFLMRHFEAASVSQMNGWRGTPGQTCRAFDANLPARGVLFDWYKSGSDEHWEPRRGEYLVEKFSPNGADYVDEWTADSTATKKILIGTIPANMARAGITVLEADGIVETSAGCASFLSAVYAYDNNLPQGAAFATGAASSRGLAGYGYSKVQCEGVAGSVATGVRQMSMTGAVVTAVRACDFSADIPVYLAILSPVVGVVYRVRRSWVKVGA